MRCAEDKNERLEVPCAAGRLRVIIGDWQQVSGWEDKAHMRITSAVVPAKELGAPGQNGGRGAGKAR